MNSRETRRIVDKSLLEAWKDCKCYNLEDPDSPPSLTRPSLWFDLEHRTVDIGRDVYRHYMTLRRDEWNSLYNMVKEGKSITDIKSYLDSLSDASHGYEEHELELPHIQILIDGIRAERLKSIEY